MMLLRKRRLKFLLHMCAVFVCVNVFLYWKSESLFPSATKHHVAAAQSSSNRRKSSKFDDDDEAQMFADGFTDPRGFIGDAIRQSGANLTTIREALWPGVNRGSSGDRLLAQLDFLEVLKTTVDKIRPSIVKLDRRQAHATDKLIYLTSGVRLPPWELKREKFIQESCPMINCYLTDVFPSTELSRQFSRPGAVVFRGSFNALKRIAANRSTDEVWLVYQLESPAHVGMDIFSPAQMPNWTATFRSTSTLPTPYEKFVRGDSESLQRRYELDGDDGFEKPSFNARRDVAAAKRSRKLVAWFVTNCNTKSTRTQYAEELRRYIPVDVYGGCGNLTCSKTDNGCFEMLKSDYKFYLAFENSNCREYVTEKFFSNALANDVIPIVMGAHPDDYRQMAPPRSYIHVEDFPSPAALATHLRRLDQNDTAYNEYFQWKGSGAFINTKFWCRLCAMLHVRDVLRYEHAFSDGELQRWWSEDGGCLSRYKQWTTIN